MADPARARPAPPCASPGFLRTFQGMPVAAKTWVRAVTAAVAVTIIVLSLLPVPQPRLPRVQYLDKILHALACLLLRPRLVLVAVFGSLLLGGLIELIQPLTLRRRELADLAADLAGATVGALVALTLVGPLTRLLLRGRPRV
jgi:VanZ family protein